MSSVSVSGTLILNSDLVCTGSVTVQNTGMIIPIANEVIETYNSCPVKEPITSDGKSPTITSLGSDITVLGQINGNDVGFPANFGPGANSTLDDSYGYQILFYGATHAGLGYADNVPGEILIFSDEFTLNSTQVDERSVLLSHHPVEPVNVVMNIIRGSSQEYYRDFYVTGNTLSWRTPSLEPLISVGDKIRIIYAGDTSRIVPPPKPRYGSYEAPLSIGSGSGETAGGSGIRLIARAGTVDLTGSITMDGGSGASANSGGGSGGSIWVIGQNITGAGLLTAMGGDAVYQYAGGGGGGYITLNYEKVYGFTGNFSVLGKKGAQKGVVFISQIEPFFIEKFTGHILNTKWWEIVEQPVVLNSQVDMDTTIGDLRTPMIQSKFGLSGKNILADIDYIPGGLEPSYHTSYFQLCVDEDNWIGISKRYGYVLGTFTIDGLPSRWAIPYGYVPTKFRFNKTDSTFLFQIVDSSAGPQTILSQVLPEFEKSKFFIRTGTEKDPDPDATRRIEYHTLTNFDTSNKAIFLLSLPVDASNTTLNILRGSSQYYGTDYTVSGQFLGWGPSLDGTLASGDRFEIQYITNVIPNDLSSSWDNFRVFTGILHDLETRESTIYVDSTHGSDTNDGLRLTPLQNLFVATAWAKRGGTVVLYDGTYNPTEVMGKNLTILGAHGASPLITTDNVLDSTGSNWENSCLTFQNCQGVVKSVSMTRAVDAIYALNTHELTIENCTITDSTTGITFVKYTENPKILRNTIHGTSVAVDMSSQVYDPYVYSNIIYDSSVGVMSTDATKIIVSSNTVDNVTVGVVLDNSSTGIVASNNITNSALGVLILDSSTVLYNNNFFGTITQSIGTVTDSSNNISLDPQYINDASGDYHLSSTSPDRTTGTSAYDNYLLDRDNVSRDATAAIGAYEVVDGTHGTGPYYVSGSGDDYRNVGTISSPYRTLDKAMSVADSSIIINAGHFDSYHLGLRSETILMGDSTIVFLDSHYSNINLSNMLFVSPNGSDNTDGTHNGSQLYPYRSISRALQDASVADTHIIVMSGDYETFTGLQDTVLVPFSDRTGVPDPYGRYYLQSLFKTDPTMFTNHVISDATLWNTYAAGRSDASIREGFLTLIYDGYNACGADSTFTYAPQFTAQATLRNALDPIFFSIHNADNTIAVAYNNGDWTSFVTTGDSSSHCWGHIDVNPVIEDILFTDYVCVSSQDIVNKYVPLTYLLADASNVAVNVIGGSPQELGEDFYSEDGKIKWDGKGLDGEITPGEILRVIYAAQGLSNPVDIKISLLPSGVVEVSGSDCHRWHTLMKRRLLSDTSSPWSTSFYMDRSTAGIDHFGRGYASKYYTLATSFENADGAVPYLLKTWRQPIILHNPDNT